MAAAGAGGATSLVTRVVGKLVKILRAPWTITGPTASPEYLPSLPAATEYRPIAPANSPVEAKIPQSNPENVYDIKYYVRDSRRADFVVKQEDVTPSRTSEELAAVDLPPTPGKYFVLGRAVHLDDTPGNGYQR
eukprot:TRINITY_DN1897_c0_g1_i2.p1 TRINITY_DN1897_c0_g1~~TRINITY_DN1897_c0_g1_i2.p1  ORF type:complete len:134 (-),score=20.34 TRINITY_DN1897_c0_g1_i2:139-540(-)